MPEPWCITLLGGLRVQRGPQVITRFKYQKVGGLLAYLAYYARQMHAREALVEIFWPESAPASGRANLSVALSSLRHQLEPPGVPRGAVLQADRFYVRLNPAAITTDVADFLKALRRANEAESEAAQRQALEQALALYGGELLPGYYEDWVIQEQHRLQALFEQAQEALQRLGAPSRLALLPSLPPISSTPPCPASRAHLPLTFTRFFGREEELSRLSALLANDQPPATGDRTPNTRRRAPSVIVHRPSSAARLVTLTGPGGVGKTRLVIEAARHLADAFPGGIWFVPLADLSDPRLIPGAVVDALGLPRSPNVEPLDQVVAFLNQTGVQVFRRSGVQEQSDPEHPNTRTPEHLLILDNFEHLLSEERRKAEDGAAVVRALLERAESLTCLVTSRHALNLEGERGFPVAPLPVPDGVPVLQPLPNSRTPEHLNTIPSVVLFVDRAQAVRPDFQLTDHNARAVAELCIRLEGIPLAIELAAARMQVLSPTRMLSQLERRFAFLVSRRRDATERHRSLYAAIEWSYRLLSRELRRLFSQLSVFRGGWTVEAVEAVCEESLALDCLEQLRECSLILSEETPLGMRFRMLETLREHAAEQLSEEEREDACARHAAFFLRLAEESHPSLFGENCTIWLDRLETEMENLRAALDWHQAQEDLSPGLRLVVALFRYWDMRGHAKEGYERLMTMLRRGADAIPDLLHARAFALAGHLAQYQGNYAEAAAWSAQQLAIARALADRPSMVDALCRLGNIAYEQGDLRAAYPICAEALALARELGNGRPLAQALFNVGCVLDGQKDYVAAGPILAESLCLYRELGDARTVTFLLLMSASTHFGQGDYATATAVLREALTIQESLSDRSHFPNSLEWLAMCAAHQQRPEKAARLFGVGERLREDIHFTVTPANRLLYDEHIAQIRAALGESTFTACWAEGRAMTLEQAIAYALRDQP